MRSACLSLRCACVSTAVLLTSTVAGKASEPVAARAALPAPKPALTLHVAPNGSDSSAGTRQQPFATLERARDAIRALGRNPYDSGGVLVLVHGGEYAVRNTFTLSSGDSGGAASPLRFQAVPGEKPVFGGGVRLRGWRRLSDPKAFPLLPPEARPKVWVLELKSCGVTNLLPLKLGGFASGNGFKTHPAHELFFNGKAMQLARGQIGRAHV